jgi:multidrug efflux pump
MTEPFFIRLMSGYKNSLANFMKRRWMGWAILVASIFLIFGIGSLLQSELSPLEDRSGFRIIATTPEGTSYESMDNYMDKLAAMISDSVPENRIILTVTAPNFSGSGSVNSGLGRIMLTDPDQRKRTQQQIVDNVSASLKRFPEAKTFAIQEQSISAGGGPKGTLPVQFVIQAPNFEKLKEVLPKFMLEVNKDSVFQGNDVNLKFNRPELQVTIDRDKARALDVSVMDVAQTLQLSLSGQRFGYFPMN